MLAKIEYLNSESAKWKTTFKIMMSPYSFLRAMGLSPQMAIGLLAVGGTAGTGVVVNETVLAERSFTKQFRLADNMEVKNADLRDGLLTVNLYREIPEAEKPKQIKINAPGLIKKAASALSSKKVA